MYHAGGRAEVHYLGDPFGFLVPGSDSLLMLNLQSYFDESGTIENNRTISFCGFVGTNPEWAVCHGRWKQALDALGITTFKANTALHYKKPLSHAVPALGIEKRVRALTPLINAIRSSVTIGVSTVLDCVAFKALPEKDRGLFRNDPTYLTFVQALVAIQSTIETIKPKEEEVCVSIICDDTYKYASEYLVHRTDSSLY